MLTQVNIKNFKSINDEKLKLTPLTILTGTNSSGKSSVIQAIMLMIMNSTESNQFSMESLLRYVGEFKTIRNKRTNAKIIEISLLFLTMMALQKKARNYIIMSRQNINNSLNCFI